MIGRSALALALLLAAIGAAEAADFAGRVTTPANLPAAGAMVTVIDAATQQRETVYTDSAGAFAIRTPYTGPVAIRARLAGFADAAVTRAAAANEATLDLRLADFADTEAASGALPASAFNAHLPWPDVKRDRPPFISQCNYCHQIGNATTRAPRSHEAWIAAVDKMDEGLLALLSTPQKRTVASVLERGFDGRPIRASQNYGAGPELARAKVREWPVGDGLTFFHDAMVGRDGKVYGTDEGHDLIWILDRDTGVIDKVPLPDIDLPRGGLFAGLKLPIGVFTGKHGPHSMAETSDGRIWITNSLSSTLMAFDPPSRRFETYPVPHDALYPHTVRVDRNDIVWFTILASNQVGRFDPKTKAMTVIELPVDSLISYVSQMALPTLMRIGTWFPHTAVHLHLSTHRIFGSSVVSFPYGIDIDPKDGGVWYAKLNTNKIGRIDPKTLAIEEWDTPMSGPRRLRFDRSGILWIPAFDEGGLMRFDPATRTFETYKIPGVGADEYETPYALIPDPASGDIWMSANNSDRVVRFSPASRRFLSYPSPTRVTVLRDFSIAADGEVCSSHSNLPSYAIEGGRAAFICLAPDGGARDRAIVLTEDGKDLKH
jgi:virginiamycin B lyase